MFCRFNLIFILAAVGFAASTSFGRADEANPPPLCYRICTVAFPAATSECSPLICASSREGETP